MASINERISSKGEKTYRVQIRNKDFEQYKTFTTKEDAELFIFSRERLINNMKNFDVPINNRVRLVDIIQLKKSQIKDADIRTICEFDMALKRCLENMKPHVFLEELTLEDWKACLDKVVILHIPIRGNAITTSLISIKSVRRLFATLSSAFSSAIASGIPIENYPLQIVQKYINPMIKNEGTC